MYVSRTVKENEPQLVRKLFDKAKEYDDVIDLTLGDPDLPAPQPVKDAAYAAIAANRTKYTTSAGIAELRRAVAADVEARTGVSYAMNEIAVTAGAMGGLYLSLVSIIDDGDEAIVLQPHWPNYTNMIKMCGGVPVFVDFLGSADVAGDIEKAVTPKTRAVIINTPSNPTGAVLPFETLEKIAAVAVKHDLWVISDEVYHTLVFDGGFRSIVEVPGMKERTILADSVSKRFSMTGFRVGYICAPAQVATAAAALQENVNSCACMFAQYAALTAITRAGEFEGIIRDVFRDRCTAMAAELDKSAKLEIGVPKATFYLFVNIKKTGLSSEQFAYRLLEEKHIAVVPGNAFNKAGEGYIRIACNLDKEILVKAAKTIADFADDL